MVVTLVVSVGAAAGVVGYQSDQRQKLVDSLHVHAHGWSEMNPALWSPFVQTHRQIQWPATGLIASWAFV